MTNLKRIMAVAGLIVIVGWIIATVVMALINFPGKDVVFPFFMVGCVVFPIFLWLLIWLVGVMTNKKTIASFRSEEMEKTMEEAESIKEKLNANNNINTNSEE